jgi:hypothetical protein
MKRPLVFLLLVMGVGAANRVSAAQAIQSAMPCDLVRDPARFDKQVVRVRATVSIAFEDFTLETPGCGDSKGDRPIWLMYGGDEPTPVPSTVNDVSRLAGLVIKVEGIPIPLTRDASLDMLRARLAAERTSFNGAPCGAKCRLYRVTATLTGVFFAGPKEGLGGYGHMGCCHLLAIEQVSDVAARRTQVPAGGEFECSVETWEIGAEEALSMREQAKKCNGLAECRRKIFDEIAAVAKQKGDEITLSDDDHFYPNFGDPAWTSPDLLKTYSLNTKFRDSVHNAGPVDGISVSRSTCKALSPALPLDTPIACRSLHSEFATTARAALRVENYAERVHEDLQTGAVKDAAARALNDATKGWRITSKRELRFAGCDQTMEYEGDKFSTCHWLDPEGMERFSLQVTKYGSLRHRKNWNSVPWILSRGSGLVCDAER